MSEGTAVSEGTAAPPASWTGELRPFDVCVGVQADYAPVFVGIELGIWEQYGLDVTAERVRRRRSRSPRS